MYPGANPGEASKITCAIMYYVYAPKCKDNSVYVGYSKDLKSRIARHRNGKVKSTKSKLPVRLVYYEAYSSQQDARKREVLLKQHKPKNDLKAQIMYSINEG